MTIFEHVTGRYVPADPSADDIARFAELNAALNTTQAEIAQVEASLQQKQKSLDNINTQETIDITHIAKICTRLKQYTIKGDSEGWEFESLAAQAKSKSNCVSLNTIDDLIRLFTPKSYDNPISYLTENGRALAEGKREVRNALQQEKNDHQAPPELLSEIANLTEQKNVLIQATEKLRLEKNAIKIQWTTTLTTSFEAAIRTVLPINGDQFEEETNTQTAISNLGRRFLNCMRHPSRTDSAETTLDKMAKLSKKSIPATLLTEVHSIIQAHERNLNKIAAEELTEFAPNLNPPQTGTAPIAAPSWMLLRPEFWKNVALSLLAVAAIILFAKGTLWGIVPVIAGAALFAGCKFFKPNAPSENDGSLAPQFAAAVK